MQQPVNLDRLKERYRFDEWKGAEGVPGGAAQLPVFAGTEFPGWRLVRESRREPAGHPPMARTMWQQSPQELMGIDIHQCASPAEAREYLLVRLGEMQGPPLARVSAPGIGEVGFATPGETLILFARGRWVAVLHSAGPRHVSLGDAGRVLDALLSGRAPEAR